jgi:mono/diheme cytochrome c family protein
MRLMLLLLAVPAFAKVNFVRQVKPILERHCVRCHGDERAAKNLRLDRQDRAMRAIVPKKPEDSTLYLAAKSGIMPPGPNKLSSEELETIRQWIAEGAHWPRNVLLENGLRAFLENAYGPS